MKALISTLLIACISFNAFASQNKTTVKLRIQASNGNIDDATVYFDQGINSKYIYQEDAQKVFSGVAGVPTIFSPTSDNIICSINGYGVLSSSQTVPIGVKVDNSGTYTITAAQLDNFDPTTIITLEDRQTYTFTDLRMNFIQAQISPTDSVFGRFFLHVSYPTSFSSTPAGCADNDGVISVKLDQSIVWDKIELFNSSNTSMGVYTKVNYNQINFTTLGEGDYRADFTFGSYNASKTFHINGIHIVASIEASAVLVPMYQNIDFSAVVSHVNHYSWDFGDGTLVEGVANPNLAYYEPGVYTVQLNTSNDNGCTATAQITITVLLASGIKEQDNKEAAIKLNGRTLNINLNENAANAEVKVFNMIGQPVYTSVLTTSISTFDLNVESNGYYVVSVKNAGKTSSKRIFINK